MRHTLKLAPLALAAALCFSGAAQAGITVYTTQTAYLAAISAAGVDTYNDLDFTQPLGTPINRTAGAYSYTASVGPQSNFFPAGNNASDIWLASNDRTDTITFNNFSSTVRGLGAFFFRSNVIGLSTATAGTLTVIATDASGTATQLLVNPTTSTFLGFVSTGALSSVSLFVGTQGVGTAGIWPTINDLTLGAAPAAAAVPEPASWAMMIGGLGLIGASMRRRKTTLSFA